MENISSPLFCSNFMCPFCGRERTVNRIADTLQILQNREDHGQHSGTHKHDEREEFYFYCTGKLHLFVGDDNCSCLRSALTSGRSGLLDDEVK